MTTIQMKIAGVAILASLAGQPIIAGITMKGNTLIGRTNEATQGEISGAISALHAQTSESQLGGEVRVPQAADGHFYADVLVNGVNIRFLVDTGATIVVLKMADAARAHIPTTFLDFAGSADTANGAVSIANTMLDTMVFGGISDTNVEAFVSGGDMAHSLLGMSYLSSFQHIEIVGNVLVLRR